MSYSLIVVIPKDHKLTAWLPLGRGLLRFIKTPSRTQIPQGNLEITIERGSGQRIEHVISGERRGYESVTYKWLSPPRRDVWWATGRSYNFTSIEDTGEFSRLLEMAAHGNTSPILHRLFASLG